MKSSLLVFSLMEEAFYVRSLKSLPDTRSERFSPIFYSRTLVVLGFMLRSVKHFMLIFLNAHDEWSYYLYICIPGYFSFTCWKEFLSPLSWVCFWLSSSPVISGSVSVLSLIPYYPIYMASVFLFFLILFYRC